MPSKWQFTYSPDAALLVELPQVNARTYNAALRDKLQMEVDAASGLFYNLLKRFDGG